ncbi:MAG: DUF2721 domain-containing protein [Arenicella sp.]
MILNVTDPAILFPGISLLFLAYTNRYLALSNVVRQLNRMQDDFTDENREKQIDNLRQRLILIKYMQASGVLAFIFCICSMAALLLTQQSLGQFAFATSLSLMLISLAISLREILISGKSLRIELERPHHPHKQSSD